MRILIAVAMVFVCSAAASAETPSQAQIERQTLESFAAADAACREWSDGCAVCTRHADARFACSLPGIACQPAAITCSATAAPAPQPAK